MPNCVFRRCKNYIAKVKKDGGVSYHTFPSDEHIKHKWIKIVQKERSEQYWLPSKCDRICSTHFQKEDLYTTKKGYVRLQKTAVPRIQLDDVLRDTTPTSLDDDNISDVESDSDNSRNATTPSDNRDDVLRAATPHSLDDVSMSDVESISDNPRKATLKNRVRKLKLEKKELQNNNKNLKYQNNKLKKRITNLKKIVKFLKQKNNVKCSYHPYLPMKSYFFTD